MIDYASFLETKRFAVPSVGIDVEPERLCADLFPFQRDLTRWALRKGRAALFCYPGLGKTPMQLAWAQHAGERVLILAPLAVAQQTVREGDKFGIPVRYVRSQPSDPRGISVTNYEMLDHFDTSAFDAVVLDESGILKSYSGATRNALIEAFRNTPMRLCCTATPAPNDTAELANHAEFLGILNRPEMLATFFVHDENGWRLKGHAREPFYRWLASWGMSLRRPSDLGYADDGYDLPPLHINSVIVRTDYAPPGQMFVTTLKGIGDRAAVRRDTLTERVAAAVRLIRAEPAEKWLIWCGLNAEQDAITTALGSDCVSIDGNTPLDQKVALEAEWRTGSVPVLVSKPAVFGWGMNWQHCARMAFVGLSDSYEQYFQTIRRCYRFGQQREVRVFIVLTDIEETIYANVLRKEVEAERTAAELVKHVAAFERAEIGTAGDRIKYLAGTPMKGTDVGSINVVDQAFGNDWAFYCGDSAEVLSGLASASIALSVFSPPFESLYTYSATERDLGNSRSPLEFWRHFSFISRELLRVMMPGRIIACHVADVPSLKERDGVIGLKDFSGATIRHFQRVGFTYHGRVTIDKDPQAQAIRTKSKGLLFTQMHKDSSWSRPAMADYILLFRTPGENQRPIVPDLTNDEWIEWARPIWYRIRESDTLNIQPARSSEDERHIAPLQLGTIERCVRLWSNSGEIVLSPFGGIASEGHEAVRLGRRFIGVELKATYWKVGVQNLKRAESLRSAPTLFSTLEALV